MKEPLCHFSLDAYLLLIEKYVALICFIVFQRKKLEEARKNKIKIGNSIT